MGNYGSVVELRAIQKEALIVGRGVGNVAGKREEERRRYYAIESCGSTPLSCPP